ncbi:MAG: hypothetical protein HQ557_16220 [Bacteroidetes bacterium]|nr:hypothetical protein [Bacteroidota bacterium]
MDLLKISELQRDEIEEIYVHAAEYKNGKKSEILKNKSVITIFPQSSLRTRLTFETAVNDLSGRIYRFDLDILEKSEALQDVILYLNNWVDLMIIRYPDITKIEEMQKYATFPIINAMTRENHPCEIVSDYFGLREMLGSITDLTYTFIGPAGNILNSWINIAKIYSLDLKQIFHKHYLAQNRSIKTSDQISEIKNSDIILTDPFPKEFKENNPYTLTKEILQGIGKDVIVNPCPPFRRNVDISDEVLTSQNFVGYEFKKNLVYVQKAIIECCLKN